MSGVAREEVQKSKTLQFCPRPHPWLPVTIPHLVSSFTVIMLELYRQPPKGSPTAYELCRNRDYGFHRRKTSVVLGRDGRSCSALIINNKWCEPPLSSDLSFVRIVIVNLLLLMNYE